MNRLRLLAGKALVRLGVPQEIATRTPKLTMLGTGQLLIENHKGLIEYSSETVRVKTHSGSLEVSGSDLLLDIMDSYSVSVSGRIFHITTAK